MKRALRRTRVRSLTDGSATRRRAVERHVLLWFVLLTVGLATAQSAAAQSVTLSAAPDTMPTGGTSTLTWVTADVDTCTASDGWTGALDAAGGSQGVSPTTTTLYTVTCDGPGGQAVDSATITVGPAVTATLGADVDTIPLGGTSQLTWSSTDATSCIGTNFDTAGAASGSISVTPATTTLYSVTCTGTGGATSAPAQQTVSVGPAVTATLGADVDTIPLGGTSQLTWSSTDATSCAGTGFDTGAATSGSVAVAPTTTTLYSVVCTGAGGATSPAAEQTVTVGAAVTATLGADLATLPLGGSSLLTWSSTDATSCIGTNFDTAGATSGSAPVTPLTTTLYSVVCSGAGGATSAPAEQTVTVGAAVTASLGADVDTIPLGGSSLLTWSSTDATSCTGTGFETSGATSGSVAVAPTTTTLYALVCTGVGGATSSAAEQTVTVGAAVTATLDADFLSVPLGGTSQLTWSGANADSCTGTNFTTGDAAAGSVDVSPTATTVYSITCTGSGGATSNPVDVTVSVDPAVSATLITTPSAVPLGGSADLTWSSTSATSCTGTGFSTGGAPSGSISVAPATTTAYSVTCAGNGGASSAPADGSLTIGPPVTSSLSANPTTIALGGSSGLTWGSTDAISCTGTGFSTGGAASGTVSVSPGSSTIYSVTCVGAGGATSSAATASVAVGGGVTAFLTADFDAIPLGGSSLLSWSSSNATSCTGTGFTTGGAVAGSVPVSPTSTTVYAVDCTGSGGANDSAEFTVAVGPAISAALTATPDTIALGGASSLEWSSSNATSCTGIGFSTGGAVSGQIDVSPTTSSAYGVTCTGNGGANSPIAQATVTVSGPVAASLSATPAAIALGGSTTLEWSGVNATSCVGSGFDTGAAASGSVVVTPTADSDYSVTCTGAGGATSAPASTSVTVGAAVGATLTATPGQIAQGGTSTLDWSGDNATSCVGVGFSTGGAPSGSIDVAPATTTAYSVTCSGAGGATSPVANATVTVGAGVTASLVGNPTSIASGGSSELTWGSTNATSCTASSAQDAAWNGARSPGGGTVTVTPTVDSTYALTCTGAGGASSPPATTTITVGAAVTASLAANPTAMPLGGTSQLTWGSTNATSCTASSTDDPAWNGSRAVGGGTLDVTPTATATYTIVCAGAGGAESAPANVTVVVGSAVTVALTATPESIAPGGSSQLTWSSGSATSCTGTGFDTAGAPNGSAEVSPTTTTNYSVLCTGAGGATSPSAAASVTVGSAVAATLTATPSSIAQGGSSELSWSSVNATSCTGTGFATGGATSGSVSVSPILTTAYTLTCEGAGGATSPVQNANVSVGPAVTASLDATALSIALGGSSELSWSSTNATSCTASSAQDPSWSGGQPIGGGTLTVSPTVTSTYTLTCEGAGGATSTPASVTIAVGEAVTATLGATLTSIAQGGTSDLTWGSANASSCVASSAEDASWNGARSVAGGTVTVTPTVTSTYQLVCAGAGGASSTPATVTISVGGSVSAQLNAAPSIIAAGGSSTLTWSSSNATSCSGTGFSTSGATSGSVSVSPTTSTTYSMSCSGEGGAGSAPVNTTVTIAPLPTVTLTATPSTIAAGNSTTLDWVVSEASSCIASSDEDPSWAGARSPTGGSLGVTPAETATYTLSCTDAFDQQVEDSVTVIVSAGPTVELVASPETIAPLGSSSLSWSVDNAVSCTAFSAQDPAWTGSVPVDGGPVLVTPQTNATYTLTCTDAVGQAQNAEATVNITPTVTLTADPNNVLLGGSTALAWATTNATSCDASGALDWSGTVSTGPAAALVTPTVDTVYTITCTGPGGVAIDTAAVTVSSSPGDPPPTVILNADPLEVGNGGSSTLSWVTTDAVSCTASGAGDWSGSVPIGTASRVVRPTAPETVYTLTCANSVGAERSADITVRVAPPPALELSADPVRLAAGASTQINWSPTDAQSCSASAGWSGAKTSDGDTESIVVNETTTFTLECTGLSGTVSQSVTVTVVPEPTLSFTSTRTLMAAGGRTRLSWSTTDVDTCVAGGSWQGARDPSGTSAWLTPLETADYTLTCTGVGGVASETLQVVVDPERAVGRLASWGEDVEAFRNDLVVVASFDDGIHIVDISDPTSPTIVDAWDPVTCIDEEIYGPEVVDFMVEDVEIDGSLAYLSTGPCGVWIVDLDALGDDPVAIFDTEGWTEAVELAGDIAYVADYNGGVVVLDVSDPADPFELTRVGFDDPDMGAVLDIDVSGDTAYVAADGGLRVLDVSDPSLAIEIGRFDTESIPGAIPQDVLYVDGVVYMPIWTAGLLILSADDPTAPVQEDSISTAYAMYEVKAEGTTFYVSEGTEGVRVLRITTPQDQTELERIDPGKFVWGIERTGGRTVVSFGDLDDDSGGLQVIIDR